MFSSAVAFLVGVAMYVPCNELRSPEYNAISKVGKEVVQFMSQARVLTLGCTVVLPWGVPQSYLGVYCSLTLGCTAVLPWGVL